ncbi:hypothetical protein [Methylobacterium sp. WCS2018Hpa-22]|uniref:hypothetical protein n=2 Tax=Methylobacterium TaxID=407 RepID=UPI00288A89CF|nr:hypothetical protein [Methylobacterium sp. WCS2018Hpa-22]
MKLRRRMIQTRVAFPLGTVANDPRRADIAMQQTRHRHTYGTGNARTPHHGVPMLSLFIANTPAPAEEPIDRDPGVITLAAALIRAVRRQHDAAFRRRCEQATTTTAV